MKIEKSSTMKLKCEALRWLRIDQRCMFIATEVGGHAADVLGCNEKKLIEIEVKVTFDDFKNDFKKYKHGKYGGQYGEGVDQWVPTHFYFAVTDELVQPVTEYLAHKAKSHERFNSYGIISLGGWRVVKRAKWLHKNEPNNRVKGTMALRMGSELIRFHEAWI